MPYNAGTNRKAKDFNYWVHNNLKLDVAQYGTITTIWDSGITTGTSVVNSNGTSKDALISGYETSFANNIAAWNFTKNAGNPLISQLYSGSYYEFYPPALYKDGTNYRVMAKCGGDGYAYTSTDGVTWVSDGLFIAKGAGVEFDSGQASPNVLKKVGSTYYCFYSCYVSGDGGANKVALATNTAFTTSGWVKDGVICDVSAYNTANGTSYEAIGLSDIVLVGTTYYYFGSAWMKNGSAADLVYGVGAVGGSIEDVVLDTKIATAVSLSSYYVWLQGASVFKHPTSDEWFMTFTLGNLTSSGTNNQAQYLMKSGRTDVPIFGATDFQSYQILAPDTTKNYEDNYNYAANWLKDDTGELLAISGNYYFYYSGHQTGSATYTGVMCLATIPSIPT